MGFKVNYKGLEVICDTFEDLDFLAESANRHKNNGTDGPRSRTRESKDMPPTLFAEPKSIESSGNGTLMDKLLDALPPKTLDLLSVLVAKGAMTDKALRSALQLENNMQIAGRTSPISRKAKKLGLTIQDILVTKMVSSKPGNRRYEYYVPESAHAAIRQRIGST